VRGIWAALGALLRKRGALCTAAQRVGLKPRKAPCADRDSSSRGRNLENRHDSGQHHHCPVRFRTRGTAAADHSGQAAKPRRRSPIAGSSHIDSSGSAQSYLWSWLVDASQRCIMSCSAEMSSSMQLGATSFRLETRCSWGWRAELHAEMQLRGASKTAHRPLSSEMHPVW